MDVYEAVAEPSRRTLLDELRGGERTAGELVAVLPELTQPTVSRHLRVLREVGLVEVRSDAQRRIYALRARASIGPDGIGVTTADLFDRQGFIGTAAQTLLVLRR